jgi:anionic cell wall polymer biosynthesis LytR-Cps2A-Psr (LCP) family protein
VCLRRPTSDPNSGADFRAGVQTVSGAAALSFVRQRDGLPNGDLGRIRRQQVFLAAAARKVLSAGTLTSPHRLSGLLTALRRSVVTDPGLDLTTLVRQAQNFVDGDIEFVTIPVVDPDARSPTGQSIVRVNQRAVHQFVRNLIAPPRPRPTATTTTTPATTTTTTTAAPPATTARPTSPARPATPPVSERGIPCVF